MNGADVVLSGIVALSAVIGLMRGLVRELLSLLVWIFAFCVAVAYAPAFAPRLSGIAAEPMVRHVVAIVVLFVLALVAGGLLQWVLQRLIETTGLTGTDRLLGFIFGALRGVVVCVVALMALSPFARDYDWWQSSTLVGPMVGLEHDVTALFGVMADTVRDLMNRKVAI
jgi:membrane protein required for colicin V production